jgi:hypothetical protein
MNDNEILNAGFDSSAQSPEGNLDITTAAPQPSQSENPAVSSDQQPEPDPAQVLWETLQQDPYGTISFLVQHYGWQPNLYPNQPSMLLNTPPALSNPNPAPMQLDPWQELLANVALRMWGSEAAAVVKQRAQEDGLELSDQDLQSIFLSALEKYAGDIDTAYAAFAYPRLKAKTANQKQQIQEEKEPESGDLMSSIIMAGYR